MLNVEQITSSLARMPDQALQRYAAMHKNDPYIIALAMSESNRRKEMRQAAQGAQGQMPQPKVVDQAVQGMGASMPEEMGIARLPAGDMNFADGGIVAFADGGDVERYSDLGFTGYSYGDWAAADKKRRQKLLEEERARNMSAVIAEGGYAGRGLGILADPRVGALGEVPTVSGTTADEAAPSADLPGAAKTDTTLRTPPAPMPSAQLPQAGLPGLQDLTKLRQNIQTQQTFVDPAKAETEALGAEMLAGAQRRQKAFEDFTAKQGDVYKGREERIAKGEAELAGKKDQNLGLALLQAGAAMMSTPGSLGMAVGKAIDTGSKNYVAGLDKIQAAKERLADARDKMEELRLNRDDMTFKQRAAYEADIDRAKLDFKKLSIDGIRLAADVNEKRASDIFGKTVDMAKTQYEQAGANARANAQIAATLSAPERQMWDQALAKHKGDTAAAFRELQAAKTEKFNPYQSYADYLKAFAGKENVLSAPMDFASYVSQFGVPTTTSIPKDATVRKLPGER